MNWTLCQNVNPCFVFDKSVVSDDDVKQYCVLFDDHDKPQCCYHQSLPVSGKPNLFVFTWRKTTTFYLVGFLSLSVPSF